MVRSVASCAISAVRITVSRGRCFLLVVGVFLTCIAIFKSVIILAERESLHTQPALFSQLLRDPSAHMQSTYQLNVDSTSICRHYIVPLPDNTSCQRFFEVDVVV